MGDTTFLCPTRLLTDVYYGRSEIYNLQYAASAGTNGSDVTPTFFNPTLCIDVNGTKVSWIDDMGLNATTAGLYQGYQSYLVSQSLTGDPNILRNRTAKPPTIVWPMVLGAGESLMNVLNVTDTGFSLIEDKQVSRSTCQFWVGIWGDTTR